MIYKWAYRHTLLAHIEAKIEGYNRQLPFPLKSLKHSWVSCLEGSVHCSNMSDYQYIIGNYL